MRRPRYDTSRHHPATTKPCEAATSNDRANQNAHRQLERVRAPFQTHRSRRRLADLGTQRVAGRYRTAPVVDGARLRRQAVPLARLPRSDAPASAATDEPNYLAAEADRLEGFKQALYAAFLAAPKTGIPTALVDLAATYTSALRLQLTLRGYSAMPQRTAKAAMFTAGRGK